MEFWRKRVRRRLKSRPVSMVRVVVGMLVMGLVSVACGAGSDNPNVRGDTLSPRATPVSERVIDADQSVPWDSLRGIIYPPFPDGYTRQGGMMIGDDHALSEIRRANETFLLLSKFVERTPSGSAIWQVEAALRLPPTREGESMAWVDCSVDGLNDATVVAIGVWRSSPRADSLKSIRQAWRPDLTMKAFEFITPSRVACVVAEDRL